MTLLSSKAFRRFAAIAIAGILMSIEGATTGQPGVLFAVACGLVVGTFLD